MEGYELIIGEKNGPKSYVIWELFEIERNRTKLKITVFPYLFAKTSKFLPFFPFWIKPRLRRYLHSVISGFDYYLQTGKPVLGIILATIRGFLDPIYCKLRSLTTPTMIVIIQHNAATLARVIATEPIMIP